ncbi:hypothetical protein KR054_009057, partial [Drosophila jambulina]
IILKRIKVFSASNEALNFNTSVIATIRTTNDEPVYSKLYPYPMETADFVNNEIKELLQNGIIRPSRSPYNSPTWVVDKKGTDDNGSKKKRLVIDFRKLNERTIADRYPERRPPFIDENNGKVFYTPGKQNLVADALSRQPLNYSEAEAQSDVPTVYSELSLSYTIESTDKPLNCFRNQIILEEAGQPLRRDFIVFGNRTRHIINFNNKDSLVESVKEIINANVVNAIHCDFPTLARIQHALRQEFPATKFWHC